MKLPKAHKGHPAWPPDSLPISAQSAQPDGKGPVPLASVSLLNVARRPLARLKTALCDSSPRPRRRAPGFPVSRPRLPAPPAWQIPIYRSPALQSGSPPPPPTREQFDAPRTAICARRGAGLRFPYWCDVLVGLR
jgi:hypothetical protein